MLIKSLKKYHPSNFLVLIFIGILVWIRPLMDDNLPGYFISQDPMPFYNWIVLLLSKAESQLIGKIIALIIVIVQAIIVNAIINQYNLSGLRSYLPGIIFLLLSSTFEEYQMLHPILFANFFLLFAWNKIISIPEKNLAIASYYNSAFLIGIATLFYPDFVYFLLLISLSLVLNRVGHPREFAMIILGFVTVWYFYIGLYYLFEDKVQLSGLKINYLFSFPKYNEIELIQKILAGYIGLIIIAASLHLGTYIANLKIQVRRNYKILFVWFWIGILLFLFTNTSGEILFVISVPSSILISIFFAGMKKKWMAESLWGLFLILIILSHILPGLTK
ncbi:MAG: DUF6427 family protein [Bacteroidales bacterium]